MWFHAVPWAASRHYCLPFETNRPYSLYSLAAPLHLLISPSLCSTHWPCFFLSTSSIYVPWGFLLFLLPGTHSTQLVLQLFPPFAPDLFLIFAQSSSHQGLTWSPYLKFPPSCPHTSPYPLSCYFSISLLCFITSLFSSPLGILLYIC